MDFKNASPQEMAEFLQEILRDTPDFITLLDEQGNFLYLNRVVAGLKAENILGTPLYTYVPAEYVDLVKSSLKKSLTADEPVYYETVATGPNNSQAFYYCRMTRHELGGKNVVLCISTDVTEHRNLETKLKAQINDLELLNRSMVDRELKMTELKKEIAELKKQLSR